MDINNTIKDISILYKLSLSIGQSLDLDENCNNFLRTLMSQKKIDFSGMWIQNSCLPYCDITTGYKLVYSYPQKNVNDKYIPESLFLENCFNDSSSFSKKLTSDVSKIINFSKEDGAITFYQLADIGFLVLYSSKDAIWTQKEQTQLISVIKKFAISVKACLFNQKSIEDLIIISTTKNELEKAKKEAKQSDKLKSAFLSNISHEIRTPINAIVGFSNLLNDKDINEKKHEEFINLIGKNSRKLLKQVNNLIDVSKIDSNQMPINKECFYVNSAIHDLDLKYRKFQDLNDNITLKAIIPDGCEQLNISTDRSKLLQIFENLLDNAYKFTKSGCVEFGYYLENSQTPVFYIKDTGVGIPSSMKDEVFNIFRQGQNSSTRNFEGTGIGLALCKRFIDLLDGEIWFHSKEGTGSNFYFRLSGSGQTRLKFLENSKPTEVENESYLKAVSLNYTSRKILIAEDVKSNFNYLNAIIEMTDADVIWAKNGSEAISICQKEEQIDLILMDIRMPEIGGLEAIKRIKQINKNTPVIVQTAFSFNNEKEECLLAGANEFITKPIDPQTLIKILKKYLD
ncbi:hybrid sensor histidine kinase/response regulator [Ancylomarina longa]|uniref:histidine kinase n=1 Tax=Ancylomarina longa TaxID=2487017 RepID=A0A434AYU9_9BACT|nr:response regulator [Ancylomarina longa]RUT79799.1 response regulator [Ancylomarina longa]